jgi:hypothetical protein
MLILEMRSRKLVNGISILLVRVHGFDGMIRQSNESALLLFMSFLLFTTAMVLANIAAPNPQKN